MGGSVNKVILIGNLGADPEIRNLPSGGKVANIRLACTDSWRDRNSGERKERTEWVSVVVFSDGLVGVVEKYLRKGSKVYVEGSLQTRKWEKDGQDHYKTECVIQNFGGTLVMLDSPDAGSSSGRTPDFDSGNEGSNPSPAPNHRYSADKTRREIQPAPAFEGGMDDDLPF